MKELLIGCGCQRKKVLSINETREFKNLVTLDNNPEHKPDVIHDLTVHPLPFFDNEFDEIHAYQVLEHLAYQGNHEFFFSEFSEYARILKPNGHFFASVPSINSKWLWGDPSHKRVITSESLCFLYQESYKQVGETMMSDFRYIYKADFKSIFQKKTDDNFYFVLEVIK